MLYCAQAFVAQRRIKACRVASVGDRMDSYLSTQEIAVRLGVHGETVRRWLRAGELHGISLGRAGYRIPEAEFQRFLIKRQGQMAPLAFAADAAPPRGGVTRHRAIDEKISPAADDTSYQIETVFEAITDGIFIVDTQGRVPRINRAARAMLLVADDAPATYPPIPSFDLLDGAGQPIPRAQWPQAQLFAGQDMQPGEAMDMLLRTQDGRVRQINITGAPLRDGTGAVTSAVIVCRDVTERRQLERRTQQSLEALLLMAEAMTLLPTKTLSEAERNEHAVARHLVELMRHVLGAQRASLTTIDPATRAFRSAAVAGITPAEERLWRERRPGAVLRDYLTQPGLDARLRAEGAVMVDFTQPPWNAVPAPYGIRTMLLVSMEIEQRQVGILALDHDGQAHQFSANEFVLAQAVGKLGAFVLERERLLRERAEALAHEEALRAANQRMDDFLSVASHELRTPMTTIKMSVQLLERRLQRFIPTLEDAAPDLTPKLREMHELAQRAGWQADRQSRLMSDLLDATRIQAGKLTYRIVPSDLAAVAQECVMGIEHLDPRRAITLTGADEPCVAAIDADRISQVITNYLTNALKYSAAGAPVEVTLHRDGDQVRLAVQDHGIGLTTEAQQHIWERFYRATEGKTDETAAEGLGLGLFICRTIITAHHGQVGVESSEGIGSTFWFTVPVTQDEGAND